ncbi:MAG TPA: hypothetical protein VF994_11325 [Myxococcales bacterium]
MRAAILLVASVSVLVACGGSGGGTPSGPFMVNLTSAGANPNSFTALSQAQVQFTNNDSKPHQISSSNCPEMSTPSIPAGMSATVTLAAGPKSCTFSDSPSGLQGSVNILAPGNGY